MELNKKGILTVISGPAGTGKGTVVKSILTKQKDSFSLSVSATTRTPRVGEIDGVHYHFITKDAFINKINAGDMLEYAQYCGNYYGTPRENVESLLDSGINVILEIEVQGALNVRKLSPDALLILLLPPNYQTLEARLRGRGTNTEEDILNRLEQAKFEIANFDAYDYIVINESGMADAAADEIIGIVNAEKHKTGRNNRVPADFMN